MRILVVSHPPLSSELGAAQIALNLSDGLRRRGHVVVAWSPEPLPSPGRGWNRWRKQRREIEKFIHREGPFDVIDCPAISVTPLIAGSARVVARSVQPEILYLKHEATTDLRCNPGPRSVVRSLAAIPKLAATTTGWRRSSRILCLGSTELARMKHRYPQWSSKLSHYVVAPSAAEQTTFRDIRAHRDMPTESKRFLWIGRWASHKGTRDLLEWAKTHFQLHRADSLTVAGCGSTAAEGVRRALLHLPATVLPSFTRAELPLLLRTHDVGLFTSSIEGWGLCLNEMLESGMPVLATKAGGVADLSTFFPGQLHQFPGEASRLDFSLTSLDERYYARFDWTSIAASYEQALIA